MALTLITPPSVEPISLDELKAHCRVSSSAEDSLMAIYIGAAREAAEGELGRALIDQTWRLTLDRFGGEDASGCAIEEIRIPKPNVRTISSVTYIDTNGDEQTLANDRYALDSAVLPGWLYPADGADWPDTDDVLNAVTITFVAGFGATAASVPAPIRAWILLTAAFLYGNREALSSDGRIAEIPGRFTGGLLDPFRVFGV
jgi:uncharacterized phiE125 gp8 family phage protein